MKSVFENDKIGEIRGRKARIFKSTDKPIFHCQIKKIGRSTGRSAVACSAYRSGEKLTDENGIIFNFQRKDRVVHSEISLPPGAPEEFRNRQELWRAVERTEKQKNAVLAREIEVALPRCLELDEQVEVLKEYINPFVQQGFCADWSIHDDGNGNPHCHIMLTARKLKDGHWMQKEAASYALDENGNRIPVIDPATGKQKIGPKGRKMWKRQKTQRSDFRPEDIEKLRGQWAEVCNRHLEPSQRIDHRSLKAQGIDRLPTIHEGFRARLRKQKGLKSDVCDINEKRREENRLNAYLCQLKQKKAESERRKEIPLSKEQRESIERILGSFSKSREFQEHPQLLDAMRKKLEEKFKAAEKAGIRLDLRNRQEPQTPPKPKAKELER